MKTTAQISGVLAILLFAVLAVAGMPSLMNNFETPAAKSQRLEKENVQEKLDSGIFEMHVTEFSGHKWLTTTNGRSVHNLHHPDCPCKHRHLHLGR